MKVKYKYVKQSIKSKMSHLLFQNQLTVKKKCVTVKIRHTNHLMTMYAKPHQKISNFVSVNNGDVVCTCSKQEPYSINIISQRLNDDYEIIFKFYVFFRQTYIILNIMLMYVKCMT
jgi:hypothetical protein